MYGGEEEMKSGLMQKVCMVVKKIYALENRIHYTYPELELPEIESIILSNYHFDPELPEIESTILSNYYFKLEI